jgi:hypothetical protein
MKRFITSILIIIYATFSAGATMHLHYCMGEFVNASLFDTNSGSCSKCGMDNHSADNDCCKDVEITAKISDAHYSNHIDHTFQYTAEEIIPQITPANQRLIQTQFIHTSITYSPPGEQLLYIEFRNLRI